ncbi:class I SAM-dependent methyltransferase [bacterium]|nr:class I SAM-dependent methyltransferase [bacterium]
MSEPPPDLEIGQPHRLVQWVLNVFFHLLYHPFAWTYDLVSWIVSWGQWQEWIRTPLPYLGNSNILELGSGPGHLLLAGQQDKKKLFGFDLSPQMLRQAQRRLHTANIPPPLIRGDGKALPFHEAAFSQVVATFPTEYIFTKQTLREIHRVLEPQGEFLCVPMAWMRERGVLYKFLGWLFRFTGQSKDLNQIQLDRVIKLFSQVGFDLKWEVLPMKHSDVLLLRASKNHETSAR